VNFDGDGGAYCEAVEARLAELKTMRYAEYLASPEWNLQRRTALRRAGGRCEACNRTGKLNVHHRTYERRGDEAADDLIVLCADCHGAVHWHGGAHRPRIRS
jgi:5-methylcytosine-specific restriction endonuclease McrA